MAFAPEKKTYDETRKRSSKEYVKFSTEYRTVLRILDTNAELVWKHWVPEANAGKGMGAVCPNVNAQTKVCPIDLSLEGLDKTDAKVIERRARKRYMVNVLDRTPHTVCDSCNTSTPGKKCTNCGNDLKKLVFKPLNRVKILEQGPQLFLQGLNPIEQMGQDDWGVDITGYDIVFQTSGSGRDRKIAAVPQQPSEIPDEDFIDPETNEVQKKFDLSLLAEPNTIEEIELMLKGATMADLNELRGIAV
jgi:hypothetical protein